MTPEQWRHAPGRGWLGCVGSLEHLPDGESRSSYLCSTRVTVRIVVVATEQRLTDGSKQFVGCKKESLRAGIRNG